MEYITSFILSLLSYFIIAHFIYRLSNRKNWSYIFLSIMLISSLFEFIPLLSENVESKILLLIFMSRVLPVIFAFVLFLRFTGGIQFKKINIKRKKFKNPDEDIFTTSYLKKIIYIMFIMSLAIAALAYFFIDGYLLYILAAIALFVIIYGIVKLYQLRAFKCDKVMIIIGREKELVFETTLDQKLSKLHIKDIYHNEDYLIDRFATIHIYENKALIEKHYLYWIATTIPFEIENKEFKNINLDYKEHIQSLMKYHDAIIKLERVRTKYHVIKETKFRK